MHDLDDRLASWRTSVAQQGMLSTDDLDELEQHVRDTADDLSARGLSPDEALLVALRRAGDPTALAAEYRKVSSGLVWAGRWYWMAAGFLVLTLALGAIETLSRLAASLVSDGHAGAVLLGAALAGYAVVGLGMFRSASASSRSVAALLQGTAAWVDRHPLAAGVVLFAALVTVPGVSGLALSRLFGNASLENPFVWSVVASRLLAAGAPVLLLLLARHARRRSPGLDPGS